MCLTAGVQCAAHGLAVTCGSAVATRGRCRRRVAIEFTHRSNHGTDGDQKGEQERERATPHDESSIHGAYSVARRSLRALTITETELKVIAALAMIGLSSRPNSGYRTPAATGTPNAL